MERFQIKEFFVGTCSHVLVRSKIDIKKLSGLPGLCFCHKFSLSFLIRPPSEISILFKEMKRKEIFHTILAIIFWPLPVFQNFFDLPQVKWDLTSRYLA